MPVPGQAAGYTGPVPPSPSGTRLIEVSSAPEVSRGSQLSRAASVKADWVGKTSGWVGVRSARCVFLVCVRVCVGIRLHHVGCPDLFTAGVGMEQSLGLRGV